MWLQKGSLPCHRMGIEHSRHGFIIVIDLKGQHNHPSSPPRSIGLSTVSAAFHFPVTRGSSQSTYQSQMELHIILCYPANVCIRVLLKAVAVKWFIRSHVGLDYELFVLSFSFKPIHYWNPCSSFTVKFLDCHQHLISTLLLRNASLLYLHVYQWRYMHPEKRTVLTFHPSVFTNISSSCVLYDCDYTHIIISCIVWKEMWLKLLKKKDKKTVVSCNLGSTRVWGRLHTRFQWIQSFKTGSNEVWKRSGQLTVLLSFTKLAALSLPSLLKSIIFTL